MSAVISSRFVRHFRDRMALLWVSQRYDLLPDENTHGYDTPFDEAVALYRTETNDVDVALANLYWEAVWLEGANSPIMKAIRSNLKEHGDAGKRPIVTLASEDDAKASVSSQEFLPITVLPGILDQDEPPGLRFGTFSARKRERIAWALKERLSEYPGRLLVVIGCKEQSDIRDLYEILEEGSILDLSLLLLWEEPTPPPLPHSSAIQTSIYYGTTASFIETITKLGVPSASALPRWAIRLGKQTVNLVASQAQKALEHYKIVTDVDLVTPRSFSLEDLSDFFAGRLDNLGGYSVGLPVPRAYRSEKRQSLPTEIKNALNQLEKSVDAFSFSMVLPAQGGAGATTLARHAALSASRDGYPTLILRETETHVDAEVVAGFAATLAEMAIAAGMKEIPPIIILLDIEHTGIRNIRYLGQSLAAQGRRSLILQIIPYDDEADNAAERRADRFLRLPPLFAKIEPQEIRDCEEVFRDLILRWNLPIDPMSVEDWEVFEASTHWQTPTGERSSESSFWVALRFFITEGGHSLPESLLNALGGWVKKRATQIRDQKMKEMLQIVAVLSYFRIVSPLTSVLRPLTGGAFTSTLVDTLRQLEDIVDWGPYSKRLEDYVLRFFHPILAEEYLRQEGLREFRDRIQLLEPVLRTLSAGHPADVWMVSSFVTQVISPRWEERQSVADWDLRLRTFEVLSPLIRDQSAIVLHHWARCLYQSADALDDFAKGDLKRQRLELAIQKLRKATRVPGGSGFDEHPSHLFNTLGTAEARLASFLERTGKKEEAGGTWKKACKAFEHSIALLEGTNIEALLAFSSRLLYRLQTKPYSNAPLRIVSKDDLSDLAHALSLLDEAEDNLKYFENPEPSWFDQLNEYRSLALSVFTRPGGRKYINQLHRENPELGYYCEARLQFSRLGRPEGVDEALETFRKASMAGVLFTGRRLAFQIALINMHPQERFNFPWLYELYEQLEGDVNYSRRIVDLFRHAVMCYQIGSFSEGADRFRRLRQRLRRSMNPPLRFVDYWRDEADPRRPKRTSIRVTRLLSEWRADGYVEAFRKAVPLKPRHFAPQPNRDDVVSCIIRFEANGPLAVPPRFWRPPD